MSDQSMHKPSRFNIMYVGVENGAVYFKAGFAHKIDAKRYLEDEENRIGAPGYFFIMKGVE